MGPRTSGLVMAALGALAVAPSAACERKSRDTPTTFSSAAAPAGGFNQPRRGQAYAIGERAQVPELSVTVSATKQCTRDQLKPGNVILGVELSVEGRVAEVHFNPFHCKLRDSSGSSYTPTFRGCEPRLRDHRLDIDERQSGWVSFELPGSATELRLVCSQAVADQQNRVLEFDLTER